MFCHGPGQARVPLLEWKPLRDGKGDCTAGTAGGRERIITGFFEGHEEWKQIVTLQERERERWYDETDELMGSELLLMFLWVLS